jgi:hypothetical protein
MSAFDVIDEVRLSSNASNVTFSNIPDTYRDLCIMASVRDTGNSSSLLHLFLQINNTGTGSYPHGFFKFDGGADGTGGPPYGNSDNAEIGVVASNGDTTGSFAPTYLYISDYANTSTKKQWHSWSGHHKAVNSGTNEMTYMGWGSYTQTGAITTLKFYSESGSNSLMTGTYITLYGVNDS